MIFGENRKMSKEEKLGKNRAFAAAKGTFAVVKSFAAAKSRAKMATPRVRCSVAVLRRGEGTVHRGKNFRILFRKPRICTPIV